MPLFALPIDPSAVRPTRRSHLYPRTPTKRKRVTFEDPDLKPSFSSQSNLALASTNPFSLTPNEVQQYRVAGLELDQELPSKSIPDFPHRGIQADPVLWGDNGRAIKNGGGEDGEELDAIPKGTGKNLESSRLGSRLRTQHLGVLTAILHRCLLEGDIQRAKRAWAMLLRTEVNGKSIDIRSTGYWGIGAELLIRGEEQKKTKATPRTREDGGNSTLSDDGDATSKVENEQEDSEQRWGTPAGLEKAKEYYERLILQHPYRRQFSTSVNALDFWPAMLGCEIYGIQATATAALRRVSVEEENADNTSADVASDDDDFGRENNDEDNYFSRERRRDARKSARVKEASWQKRDEIRRAALLASERLAARMEELMTSPPYTDSTVLHRLRGMVALYIGDLNVPELPLPRDRIRKGEGEEAEDDEGEMERDEQDEEREYFSKKEISDRRFTDRQRRVEHRRGMERKSAEVARARKAFESVKRAGGRIEEELARLSVEGDADDNVDE